MTQKVLSSRTLLPAADVCGTCVRHYLIPLYVLWWVWSSLQCAFPCGRPQWRCSDAQCGQNWTGGGGVKVLANFMWLSFVDKPYTCGQIHTLCLSLVKLLCTCFLHIVIVGDNREVQCDLLAHRR